MIEVVHFRNRYGRQLVGVFSPEINNMSASPSGVEYAQRYAAGLEKPFYYLPAIPIVCSITELSVQFQYAYRYSTVATIYRK